MVYQRAKFNLAYMSILLLLSPVYLLIDKPTFFAALSIWGATLISLLVTTFISKFKRVGTELILTFNVLARGIAMYYVIKRQ